MQRVLPVAATALWLSASGCLLEIPEPPARRGACGCVASETCSGVWLSPDEVRALPIAGEPDCDTRCGFAWQELEAAASTEPLPVPDLMSPNDPASALVLAKALVGVRLDDPALREQARNLIASASIAVPATAEVFPIAAHLPSYVIAADLIELSVLDPAVDAQFRQFLSAVTTHDFNGRTLLTAAGESASHGGTNAAATFAAIHVYLGSFDKLGLMEAVLRGWLGDRSAHAGFVFDATALSWAADPAAPVPVNPAGATRDGHDVDGVQIAAMPSDFAWPPTYDIDMYNALGAASVTAVILARQGRDPWSWSDGALRRAARWLVAQGFDTSADRDKSYVLDLIDWAYDSDFRRPEPSPPGRSMAWTSWTHQGCR